MELPDIIESYILITLKGRLDLKDEKEKDVLDWYRQLAKCLLETGIPEKGVIELMKKHPISLTWVRRYVNMHKPEMVAQNILKYRHNPVEYDPLAKPRARVTQKKISEFRQNLEEELRRLWAQYGWKDVEDYVKEFCIDESDTNIAHMIERGCDPKIWAKNIQDYL